MGSVWRLLLLASCLTKSSGLKMERNMFFRIACEFLLDRMAPHPRRLFVFFEIVSQHRARHNNVVTERSNSESKFFPLRTAKLKKRVKCTIRSCYPTSPRYCRPYDIFLARTRQHWIDFDSVAIWSSSVELFLQKANRCIVWLQSPVPAKPLAHFFYCCVRIRVYMSQYIGPTTYTFQTYYADLFSKGARDSHSALFFFCKSDFP